MLVLSRKLDEDIVIKTPEGRIVAVKVIQLFPDRVKLGFTADPDVIISRRELLTQEEISRGLERPVTDGPISST